MNIILWIIFGGVAGWLASMIAGTDQRQNWLVNIIVGIVGAIIGGFIISLITGQDVTIGFNIVSLIVAVIGAVILLALLRLVQR